MELEDKNFDNVIAKFMNEYYKNADDRYASFDYCYNYFRRTENLKDDIEKSCLVLGFYLASWGMFRGSSFLLKQKSLRHFVPTIEYISDLPKFVWEIDIDKYDSKNVRLIKEIYSNIKEKLVPDKKAHLTLVTKTLLGVFGFVPAFDKFFCDTFREKAGEHCRFGKLDKDSLSFIKHFYEVNKDSIDNLSNQTRTIDFETGKKTDIKYTKAKIIDMYGFTVGYEKAKEKKKEKHNAKVSFLEG